MYLYSIQVLHLTPSQFCFNIYFWTIVFNTALQGFRVSVIMKHRSNITKLVLICVSIMVSTLMSMALFDL
ncbi:hypothetical protein EB796_011141 [Bugula neritina]|uniref:Uncharacterized protein n=1 Tax=Bugula neritina TaxID=10212 RepID=A0A7J7JVX1_BUGNE|nr:hypothetical protein EB796_011141 [Bugula neritina]